MQNWEYTSKSLFFSGAGCCWHLGRKILVPLPPKFPNPSGRWYTLVESHCLNDGLSEIKDCG